ncbi:MAG: cyanophycin synthetase, partial [Bacteroidales bacterium]
IDAYNANPSSMQVSLESFARSKALSKLYILGDMLELGSYSETEHQKIIDKLVELGASQVYLVGDCFAKTKYPTTFKSFLSIQECKLYLQNHRILNHQILLKASHGIHLENILDVL